MKKNKISKEEALEAAKKVREFCHSGSGCIRCPFVKVYKQRRSYKGTEYIRELLDCAIGTYKQIPVMWRFDGEPLDLWGVCDDGTNNN